MEYTWRQKLANWLCRTFGHRAHIDYDSPGGGDPEVCRRCDRLLSTAYSRSKAT